MKGIKKVSIFALSLGLALSFVACGKSNSKKTNKISDTTTETGKSTETETTFVDPDGYTYVDGNSDDYEDQQYPNVVSDGEFTKSSLSSLTLDTTNCKTEYYVGEELDITGLIVKKGIRQEGKVSFYETNEFTLNTEDVNMNKVGTYPVYITIRQGTNNITKSYNVNVKSSRFETTPNLTYVAGIQALYKDGTNIKTFMLGDIDKTDEIKLSDIELKLVTNTIDSNLNIETTYTDLSASDCEIDMNVDYTKQGTYMIKISYKASDLVIDGVTYKNEVNSFLIADVSNPVVSFAKSKGKISLEYNPEYDPIDYFINSNWEFELTHINGTKEIVSVTRDLFEVSGLNVLTWDEKQTKVTISLKGTKLSLDFTNISIVSDANVQKYFDIDIDDSKYVTGLGYQFKDVSLYSGTTYNGCIYGPQRVDEKTYVDRDGKDSADGQAFETRCSLAVGANFSIVVPETVNENKPFKLVIYYATSGDEAREIYILNSEEDEVLRASTTATKQEIVKTVASFTEPGVYKLYSEAAVYIHGFLVLQY